MSEVKGGKIVLTEPFRDFLLGIAERSEGKEAVVYVVLDEKKVDSPRM